MKTLILTKDLVFSSVQGEGKFINTPSTFVRLSGCNLRCQWKKNNSEIQICDTPYSSFEPENEAVEISSILEMINQYDNHHIVITGGEPFLQENIIELISQLKKQNKFITVETNGTIFKNTDADFLSISPKLLSSYFQIKNPNIHINYEVLNKLLKFPHQLKFVINEDGDISEVSKILNQLRLVQDVYLMPQATQQNELIKKMNWLKSLNLPKNWGITTRLHIEKFGNTRAR